MAKVLSSTQNKKGRRAAAALVGYGPGYCFSMSGGKKAQTVCGHEPMPQQDINTLGFVLYFGVASANQG